MRGEQMDELLEVLAEQSHIGWMQERQRQGFADHPFTRDPGGNGLATQCDVCGAKASNRHHPDMLPYAELPEHVKEYDRVTVRGVLAGIHQAGYRLVKESKK